LIDFETTIFEALSEKTLMKGTKQLSIGTKQLSIERCSPIWNETAQHGTK
jgi:hypothetical protein